MSALPKKVLVVDDDPVVGSSFDRVLSQQGYVVVTAHNGQEALDKLQDGDYDVVFTDIRMPGMDGLELAEQVKARKAWTPVVIVTGYGTQANEARAHAVGVTAFLRKPLSPEMIEATAREAVAQPAPQIAPAAIARTIEGLRAEVAGQPNYLKEFGLFLAAPFIGLAYFCLLPVVGTALLIGMGAKALAEKLWQRETLVAAKDAALMLAAPFVGLAYILLLPFAGLAMLAGMGLKLAAQKLLTRRTLKQLKNAVLFFAAPFIGLTYILLLPLVGLGTLAWMGLRQAKNRPQVK